MLLEFLTGNRARIIPVLCQCIRQTTPEYAEIPVEELEARVATGVEAFLEALRQNDFTPLDRFITATVVSRAVAEFPLAALHAGFTAFGELLLPLLCECYGNDMAQIIAALHRLHLCKDAILQRLVSQYETQARAVVRHQQERLQAYSKQLEAQLIQVGEEYQTLQEFNESILQSMTSGLLVGDKNTHRILKVNRAMERLGGFRADETVGRTVEEVFAHIDGLPMKEFTDEVERQGTITLRKHRLHTQDGREFYQSIKGQVFYNCKGEDQGVIVIIDDISKTELLQDTFSRYLSPQVLAQVLADKHPPALRGTRRHLSVLFADIRNFTPFAEARQPEEVVEVLNQYLDVLVRIIFEYQGTLDKFLGDGVLALFGTPLPQADHARRAVQAACAMQETIRELNAQRCRRGEMTLDIGIGINSGEAIVGNIGSEKRMEYTVIGDMVNVAQRIQTCAPGGAVLISDSTLAQVRDLVTVAATMEARVRGRQQPVWVHRIDSHAAVVGETAAQRSR
jgi:PAS domain S-box-containing protein